MDNYKFKLACQVWHAKISKCNDINEISNIRLTIKKKIKDWLNYRKTVRKEIINLEKKLQEMRKEEQTMTFCMKKLQRLNFIIKNKKNTIEEK